MSCVRKPSISITRWSEATHKFVHSEYVDDGLILEGACGDYVPVAKHTAPPCRLSQTLLNIWSYFRQVYHSSGNSVNRSRNAKGGSWRLHRPLYKAILMIVSVKTFPRHALARHIGGREQLFCHMKIPSRHQQSCVQHGETNGRSIVSK